MFAARRQTLNYKMRFVGHVGHIAIITHCLVSHFTKRYYYYSTVKKAMCTNIPL